MGAVAGTIDSIAGGGGLITIPFLLYMGFPAAVALGTNRLQSAVGELTAIGRFALHFEYKLMSVFKTMLLTVLGALLGTYIAIRLHPVHLRLIVPWLLLLVLLYYIFYQPLRPQSHQKALSLWVFSIVFGIGIGFYNGFLGPCTGSLWAAAYMAFIGYSLSKATAYAKPQNFIGNVASFVLFGAFSHVAWGAALVMGVGQIVGSNVGASVVIYKEQRWLKPIIIVLIVVMLLVLLYKQYGSI